MIALFIVLGIIACTGLIMLLAMFFSGEKEKAAAKEDKQFETEKKIYQSLHAGMAFDEVRVIAAELNPRYSIVGYKPGEFDKTITEYEWDLRPRRTGGYPALYLYAEFLDGKLIFFSMHS